MSGGGKAPKAPDVSTNIQRANDSFDTATSQSGQLWNTAQGYNQAAQDHLTSILGSTTPVMDEINRSARDNLTSYGRNFIPLQEQQAKDAQTMSSPEYVARQRALAMGDVAAANAAAKRNSVRALTNAGVDPNSVQGQALDRQAGVIGAGNIAAAGTRATQQAQDAGRAAVAGANQLGLQVGQQGANAGATGAQIGGALQQSVNQTNSSGINNLLAPSTYSNLALNANTGAANIASQNFGDKLSGYQAQQQADGALLGNVSSVIGAAAAMSEGGPVPSEGALPESPIPGSTDTKPAFLTPGEFVIPENVVRFKGEEFFHKLIDSSRMKSNERKTVPEQVLAHKTDNSSSGRQGGGVIPGYMLGGPVPFGGLTPMADVGGGNAGVLAHSGVIRGGAGALNPPPDPNSWQSRVKQFASALGQPPTPAGSPAGSPAALAAQAAPLQRTGAIPMTGGAGGYDPRYAAVA